MDYFKRLSDLLKTEREEDLQSYRRQAETTSLSDRKAQGVTWYPIAIRGSEMGRGDYLTVEVERTVQRDADHQFRFGSSVALFSQHNAAQDRIEGTVSYQSGNSLRITLKTDELPEWSGDGKLGVDLLFDDNSYEEMQNALRQASKLAEKPADHPLVSILIGEKPATFRQGLPPYSNPALNASQQSAVDTILSASELAIVHGPPGTGKTTTLVQAIKALLAQDHKQILVVAPSNTAVDLLSEKLSEQGVNTLRVGNPARVSDRLMSLTLDYKVAAHGSMKEVKKLKKRAAEFRDMAQKYKRSFGAAEREQRKALFAEARNILREADKTEQYITDDVLARAQVIAATLVGANHYTVRSLRYHTVVIDEAGQALEPACWIPILKAEKLVLAGDHCQLPPTIKSNEAARNGLQVTLLEKCVKLHPEAVVLLEEQYRMHETIMGHSSAQFYQGRLRAHGSVAHHLLFPEDSPLVFIDTAGCGFEEKIQGNSTGNPEEAVLLFKHLSRLVQTLTERTQSENGVQKKSVSVKDFPTIAIISPYRLQIDILKEQLLHSPVLAPYKDRISVNTIDSFQGQERDIVYISMTRSNADNKIGFLSDIRRMNVAMTRARKKLVVIGDSATLSRHSFYADFIGYAESKDAYHSAWEYADLS